MTNEEQASFITSPIICLLINSQQHRKHPEHHNLWGFAIVFFFSEGPQRSHVTERPKMEKS